MLIINKDGIVGKVVEDLRRASFTTPDNETILLRDLLELCELIKSRGEDCNYQVVGDGDGFLLFPMNGEGEVLRYPEEPERKDPDLDDGSLYHDRSADSTFIYTNEKWLKVDIQPWVPQPNTTPWIDWTDDGTSGDASDTLTWTITWNTDGSDSHTWVSGGTDHAAT